MWRARFNDDANLFNQASKYQMKSCEEYKELLKKKFQLMINIIIDFV